MLALHFALDHPTMVTALVLVGPIVSGFSFSNHFTSRGGRGSPGPGAPIEQRIEYWTNTDPWITAPTSTAAKARMRALMTANPTNGAGGQFARWSEPALGRLARINVPTLLITGESDMPDVHSHMGAIEAGIAGARRVVLPRAGHLPHLEVPQVFNAEVRKFLP
jgi:pimeloyl-ACP methyl ester carboxylesterase